MPYAELRTSDQPRVSSAVLGRAMAGCRVAFNTSAGSTCLPSYFPWFISAINQCDISSMLETIAPQGATPERSDARYVLVVRNSVKLKRIAPLGKPYAEFGTLQHVGNAVTGGVHLERIEDPLLNELLPGFSGLQFNQ